MNNNKIIQREENSKILKRAKSTSNYKRKQNKDKENESQIEADLIHLSLIIDDANTISLEFKRDEDISKICEKIAKKYNLNTKTKTKLQEKIVHQLKVTESEKTKFVNGIVNRLYNESVEKVKILKQKNEELKKAKEAEEVKGLTFSPITSSFNRSNYIRKYVRVEDKLHTDQFSKKNKTHVERVLNGINNSVECKQFIYEGNILRKNRKNQISEKNSETVIKDRNLDNSITRKIPKNQSKGNLLKKDSNLSLQNNNLKESYSKEQQKIFSDNKKENDVDSQIDGVYKGTTEKSIGNYNLDKNKKTSDDNLKGVKVAPYKVLKRGESLKITNLPFDSKNLIKKTCKTNENPINNLNSNNITGTPQHSNLKSNSPILNQNTTSNLNQVPIKKVPENISNLNLNIPEEQNTSCYNRRNSLYADIYRKQFSNSNLNLLGQNKSYNIHTLSKQPSFSNNLFAEEENKKSVPTKIIESTYNSLFEIKHRKADRENTIQPKKNGTVKFQLGKEEKKELISQITKSDNNKNNQQIEEGEETKKEVLKGRAAYRHFSFKDFQNYDSNIFNNINNNTKIIKSIKEDINENKARKENSSIKSEDEINHNTSNSHNTVNSLSNKYMENNKSTNTNNSPRFIKKIPSINLVGGDSNSHPNKNKSIFNFSKNDKSFNSYKTFKNSAISMNNRKLEKSDDIFSRLYKSHGEIKKKKEEHIQNVLRNTCPFKPIINKSRSKSNDLKSKSTIISKNQSEKQSVFDKLYNTSRLHKTRNIFSFTSSDSINRLNNRSASTERIGGSSKKLNSSKSIYMASFRKSNKSAYSLREKSKEIELYNSFITNTKHKEQLKSNTKKKFSDNIEKFKLNNLKEIFETIYNNCKTAEDFWNMEKLGIQKSIIDNLIIPTCYLMNERNLEFNFGNFYLISNELMNNLIK